MSKRILYINESLNTGSTGHIVEHLGLAAQQAGYECLVAHGARYVKESQLPSFSFSTVCEEYVHGGLSMGFNAHGLGSYRATKRLIARIEQYRPHLIHLHNIHGYYLHYPSLFAYLKASGIPVIWTLHDCWAMTGRCAHFTAQNCHQWETGCSHCPSYKDYPRSLVSFGVERNYQLKKNSFASLTNMTVVPVSQWLEQIVRQSFLSHCQVQTIYNGINTSVFHPMPIEKKDDKIHLLGVASQWTETKGWSDWLQLAQRLGGAYRITLVGVTEAQKKMLPHNCMGITRTDNIDQLVHYYSEADIYVNLAHQEAFGLTLIEAMACGTPCISYRTTAIPEIITPEVGVCVQDGNIDEVQTAIQKFGRQMKKEKSNRCRQYVQTLFDEQSNIAQYMALYDQIVL